MIELVLDTNDTTLLGASSSINKTKEVLSSYQLSFSNNILKKKAFEYCRSKPECSKYLSDSDSEIINDI